MSGMFDVTHGAGLAAIWPSWARYVKSNCLPRFVRYAKNVMGILAKGTDDREAPCQCQKKGTIHIPDCALPYLFSATNSAVYFICYRYFFSVSTLSSFSHGSSKSFLPKCPYAAVCL